LRTALEADPGNALLAVALARLLLARRDFDAALELLEPFEFDFAGAGLAARARLQSEGDDLDAAFEAWDRGDHSEALEALQQALAEADPDRRDPDPPGDGRHLRRAGPHRPARPRAPQAPLGSPLLGETSKGRRPRAWQRVAFAWRRRPTSVRVPSAATTITKPTITATKTEKPPNGSPISSAMPNPIASRAVTRRISRRNPRALASEPAPGGGEMRPMTRRSSSCRLDGGSWPSFSIASFRSSGRRSAWARAAFIICRSAGRSCGWTPASASLKYLRAAAAS